ncbi:MAG: hypothetical protein WCO13_00755 [Bacteroidota bacterium]
MKTLLLLEKTDKILKKKELGRKDLADEMNCSVQNLETVLRGGNPKLTFCVKLSEYLEIDLFELFEIEKKSFEPETINIIDNNINSNEVIKRLDIIIELLKNNKLQ